MADYRQIRRRALNNGIVVAGSASVHTGVTLLTDPSGSGAIFASPARSCRLYEPGAETMGFDDPGYHRERERQCRTLAERATDPDICRRHEELAELHAGRAAEQDSIIAAPSAS